MDFFTVATRNVKAGVTEIYPKFKIVNSSDLMIRGRDFYAVWDERNKRWSTDEQVAIRLIDNELDEHYKTVVSDGTVHVKHLWDAESGMIDNWHRYCQKQTRDNYVMLDEKLIFLNTDVKKEDYSSKRLPYPIEQGPIEAYNKLMSTLYSEEERHKLEWAIGSVICGDSKNIQKFVVLYGAAGTGKSTVLNIIQQLFEGYYSVFDSKALGSSSDSFALESFNSNPLVAIQHDGDLSRIEDNTRLNSLVSHEEMRVNEKFKSTYVNKFKSFLFMGTNKPVKITDAKSGLIRRLIDVSPSGNKLSGKEYKATVGRIPFELGAIAYHCQEVYLSNPSAYDSYIPKAMMGASNDFYNYVIDSYSVFKKEDGTTLKAAWEMYKVYCDEAKVPYPLPRRNFKEELKDYFREFAERFDNGEGERFRSYYNKFKTEIFEEDLGDKKNEDDDSNKYVIEFKEGVYSIFDITHKNCPAQYATEDGIPSRKWENVTTTLSDIDTSKLHYVKVPDNHIVIDFDIKGSDGKKSFEKNLEAASKWPKTYAELSKSGAGIHLHYIYTGDPSKLSRIYDDNVEIKVFTGNGSLRRKFTKCNDQPIANISSGLPLKGEDNIINWDGIKNEKMLRTMIKRNLNKEYHGATKPSIDYIYKLLDDAYSGTVCYDVSDLENEIIAFAAGSTNNADYCLKLTGKMHFKSEENSPGEKNDEKSLVFYDVEVFPNLFLVNWKAAGEDKPVVRMINPSPNEIEELIHYRLVGFNCRRYDNHILYGRLVGYSNEQLYNLSQKIITDGDRGSFFGEAYNISYTDVYDFASAGNKKSLKKFEIELGIHHQELGLPWDQPVPENMWKKVAEYCDNDVIATEATFNHLSADWTARQILADVAEMTVNDTTNSLTTRIIFGNNRKPQGQFNYRDMGDVSDGVVAEGYDEFTMFRASDNKPIFPSYKYDFGKSTYRGEEVGEGGYVYAEPGMYSNIALLDIASMHPSSIIAEELFGLEYTKIFADIKQARVAIKHEDWDAVKPMLGGKLTPYVQKVIDGELTSKQLADALKTAINSVYGLTSARFDNPFHDPRNIDNIVAKRGALFMVNLKHEVQKRGFTVAHIKTDSIKIPNATPDIIQFVMDYGKMYGYDFEHEATYDRMCLVNDAVYIAKYKDGKHAGEWTATGTQFQIPYVFKRLFSGEPIEFSDMRETKSVSTALYLDINENLPEGEHNYQFIGKVGNFCPIRPGFGGGELLREGKDKDGNLKYFSATGAKGYRWLESEMVRGTNEQFIDRSYYDKQVDDAVKTISKYGNFERFISNDPLETPCSFCNEEVAEECPFDVR